MSKYGIAPKLLGDQNYADWSACMKNYLLANDLWDIVASNAIPPNQEKAEAEFKVSIRKNAAAVHAMQSTCSSDILSQIRDVTSAKLCWNTLAKMNEPPQMNLAEPENHVMIDFRPLKDAIQRGESGTVKDFIQNHPDSVRQKIGDSGATPLHIATLAGNTEVVKTLIGFMSDDDLKIIDDIKFTALVYAAMIGAKEIAEIILNKSTNSIGVGNPVNGKIPVVVAYEFGHREMVPYLYSLTPFDLLRPESGIYGCWLLINSIINGMFDISLDLLQRCPSLTTTSQETGSTPLFCFASLRDCFPSSNQYGFWKQWIYSRIHVKTPVVAASDVRISISQNNSMQQRNIFEQGYGQLRCLVLNFLEFFGLKQVYDRKLAHSYARKILHLMCEHVKMLELNDHTKRVVYTAFIRAIRYGVDEVFVQIAEANPNIINLFDENGRNSLMIAVECRQEKAFRFFISSKNLLLLSVGKNTFDNDGNTMLHIAANLAPSDRLAQISGAALQMQRELQWYKVRDLRKSSLQAIRN